MYAPRAMVLGTNTPKIAVPKCINFNSSRHLLLLWAYIRLIVSILWSAITFYSAVMTIVFIYDYYLQRIETFTLNDYAYRLMVELIACVGQLIEIIMHVMFIVAGHKKNATLYCFYFLYSILSLWMYIVMAIVSILYDNLFMDYYITYNFSGKYFTCLLFNKNFVLGIFGVVIIVDVCLEILIILLIKRQIIKYKEDTTRRSEINGLLNYIESTETVRSTPSQIL